MKKVIALILALVYITASSGVVLRVHYCMGKVSSVSVQSVKQNICKCGMNAEDSRCCHSEFKVVKLNNLHNDISSSLHFQIPLTLVSNNISLIDINKTYSSDIQKALLNPSPPGYSEKIYLTNRVFRI